MRGLTRWWGEVAVCAALAGGPVHAAPFLPTAQLSGTTFSPGASFEVTVKLEEEFAALAIDLQGVAIRDGSPMTGVFAETPAEIPFTSTVLLTEVPDDPNPPVPVTGFFQGTGYFEFAGVVLMPSISVDDIVFRFTLTLLGTVAPGDYLLDFLLIGRNLEVIGDEVLEIEELGMTSAAFSVVEVAEIPEPATWALMLAGLAGLGCVTRRRIA